MKTVMHAAPQTYMQPWPRPTATMLFRLTGLLVAISVPTAFWTLALMLTTSSAGVALEPPALVGFSCVVAAWCLVVSMLLMDPKCRNPRVLFIFSALR
jgi:hypothetical protein